MIRIKVQQYAESGLGGGRRDNPGEATADFRGQRRSNDTYANTADFGSRLLRKSWGEIEAFLDPHQGIHRVQAYSPDLCFDRLHRYT